MANSSASTLIGRAWNVANIDGSTVKEPGIQQTELLAVLNDANNEYRRAFKRGGEPPLLLKKEKGFDLVSDTAINDTDGIATSDVAITVDATANFDSSGAIVVWDDDVPDTIEYTSKSSTVFSGVTGIDWAHEDNDAVSKLYALPSNFGSFRRTEDSPDGVMVDGSAYLYTTGIPTPFRYSLYDNGTTKYLFFPRGTTGSVYVTYNKNSTTIDDTADQVDWPAEHDAFGVYRLAQHIFLIRNDARFGSTKALGDDALLQALKDRNIGKIIRTRPMSRTYNAEASLYRTDLRNA